MKVTILGGGHGAYAAAADLAAAGHEVALWRHDTAALRELGVRPRIVGVYRAKDSTRAPAPAEDARS